MNAKFVFAVFLALQVSLVVCDVPLPDADVVQKYDDMKATFIRRIQNLFKKAEEAVAANPEAQAVRDALTGNEKADRAKQVFNAVGEEIEPLVAKARNSALGLYSAYLRPYIGPYLQDGIDRMKSVLDLVAPADK